MVITRRLLAVPVLVAALVGGLTGCGAVATAIAVAVNLLSDDGGSDPITPPPVVTNDPPAVLSPVHLGDPYDKITIEYLLVDTEDDPADITVDLSTDGGGAWMTPTISSGGLLALSASPSGDLHTFVWDSFGDVGFQNIAGTDLMIRITPQEVSGGAVGAPGFLSFDLLNDFIGLITTIAGGGISGNALAAPTVEASGDLILCDVMGHQVVRKRAVDGTVEPLAGTGSAGFNGDGLPGDLAKLNGPFAAVVDPLSGARGDVIFTDTNNHRICKIDGASGFLTTLVGTGLAGFVDGFVGVAWLSSPRGLAVDPQGNLFVADEGNHRVRLWNRQGSGDITLAGVVIPPGEIGSVAGDGSLADPVDATPATSAVVPRPTLLTLDGAGNCFTVSSNLDGSGWRVRGINPTASSRTILGTQVPGNAIWTVAGGGTEFGEAMQATTGDLGPITGIAIDGSGSLILTSWNRCREVDSSGLLLTIAGDGTRGFGGVGVPFLQAQFDFTSPVVMNNLAVDGSGNVILTMLDDIRIVNREGVPIVRGGITIPPGTVGRITPGSSLEPYVLSKVPLIGAGQVAPGAPDLLTSGEAFVADAGSHRVARVDIATGAVTTEAGINGFGGYAGDGGQADVAGLSSPGGLAADSLGNLYIADTGNHVIRFVNRQGSQKDFYGGSLLVQAGEIATIAGTGTAGSADGTALTGELDSPRGLTLDSAGNVYVADTGNHAIRAINTEGTPFSIGAVTVLPDWIARVAGTGSAGPAVDGGSATSSDLSGPEGVGVDDARNLFILDTGNGRLRLVNAATAPGLTIYTGTGLEQTVSIGTIDTIAGPGACPVVGDGGSAIQTCLQAPRAIDTSDLGLSGSSLEGWILVSGGSRIRAINAGPMNGSLGGIPIDVGNIGTIAGTGQRASTGNGGPADQAEVLDPAGISWDWDGISGSEVLLLQEPSSLRAVNLAGADRTLGPVQISPGAIDEIVGDSIGSPPLRIADPGAMVAEADGDLFIADGGKVVYHLDRSLDLLTQVAGDGAQEGFAGDGGPGAASRISSPGDLGIDSVGNLYIADTGNARIRVVNRSGVATTIAGVLVGPGEIETLAGPSEGLVRPISIAVHLSGDIYFADPGSQTIGLIDGLSGIPTTINPNGPPSGSSSGDGASVIDADIADPRCIAVDVLGNIYLVDSGYSDSRARIRVVNRSGGTLDIFPGTSSWVAIPNGFIDVVAGQPLPPLTPASEGDLVEAWDLLIPSPYPESILLLSSPFAPGVHDIYYTHAGGGSRVRRIDGVSGLVTTEAGILGAAGFNGDGISPVLAELNRPTGLASFTKLGRLMLVVSDTNNRRVRRFAP